MNKVIPKIFNGDLELILSETVTCMPSMGIQIHIPITNEKITIFKFTFIKDEARTTGNVQVSKEGDDIVFSLTNFLNPLGAAFSHPFKFHVGNETFLMQIYGVSTGEDIVFLNVSIFKEKNV